jgi:hypothetical protein
MALIILAEPRLQVQGAVKKSAWPLTHVQGSFSNPLYERVFRLAAGFFTDPRESGFSDLIAGTARGRATMWRIRLLEPGP